MVSRGLGQLINDVTHTQEIIQVAILILSFSEEALFGEAPFASDTLEELHLKVLDERPVKVREQVTTYIVTVSMHSLSQLFTAGVINFNYCMYMTINACVCIHKDQLDTKM